MSEITCPYCKAVLVTISISDSLLDDPVVIGTEVARALKAAGK